MSEDLQKATQTSEDSPESPELIIADLDEMEAGPSGSLKLELDDDEEDNLDDTEENKSRSTPTKGTNTEVPMCSCECKKIRLSVIKTKITVDKLEEKMVELRGLFDKSQKKKEALKKARKAQKELKGGKVAPKKAKEQQNYSFLDSKGTGMP